MRTTSAAFKVGLLITAGVLGWLFWFFNTSKGQLGGADTIGVFAYFKNAGGLSAKSKVTAAGLDVGQISNISLVDLDQIAEEVARCNSLSCEEIAGTQQLFCRHNRRQAVLATCRQQVGDDWKASRDALQGCICGEASQWRFMPAEGVSSYEVEFPYVPKRARYVLNIGGDGKVLSCRVENAREPHTASSCRQGFWARVDLRVKKNFPLFRDAKVEKSTQGLMGSNVLELTPGNRLAKYKLDNEAEIVNVVWQSGLESAFSTVGNLEEDISSIVANVRGITDQFNAFMGPDESGAPAPSFPALIALIQQRIEVLTADVGQTVRQINGFIGDNRHNITDVIANLTRVSEELKQIADGTGDRGEAFDKMVTNVAKVTEELRGVVTDLRGLIGASEEEAELALAEEGATDEQVAQARRRVKGIRATIDRLNDSLDSLAQVTNRIAAGEGTVGRLLTDDKIANDLEDAIEGAGNIVSGINRLDTHVKVLAWYNFQDGSAHDGISIRLQPRPDKYYLLELMDDPKRVPVYRWTTRNTNDPQSSPNGPGESVTIQETVAETTDDFRLTAQFAKMWGPLTLRVGIMENSGAVGANLQFWEDRIRLRSDLFQFGYFERLPRWRSYLEFEPIDHIFVIGGVDDVLNYMSDGVADPNRLIEVQYFAGAGISFTDEDLKSLMTVVPSP